MNIIQLIVKVFEFLKQKTQKNQPVEPVGLKEQEKILMDLAPKKKIIHINCDGMCPQCENIINKYKDFNIELYNWFKDLRSKHKDAHVAYAGRGKADQEHFFQKGTSKARYGESPHNYNLALDIFQLTQNGARFDVAWYKDTIIPEALKTGFIQPGGLWKTFKDWPHFEHKDWKQLVKDGKVKLVE
jgi:hypothetical protein